MAEMKSGDDIINGVGCDVVNCKYHGHANQCFADSISVESQNAAKKTETFCGTFAPRPDVTQSQPQHSQSKSNPPKIEFSF